MLIQFHPAWRRLRFYPGFIMARLSFRFRQSQSVSDALVQFFVYATCIAFWWKWIAGKTSIKK